MNNPARNFGLLSADRAGSLCGVDFLRGIMDGRYHPPAWLACVSNPERLT